MKSLIASNGDHTANISSADYFINIPQRFHNIWVISFAYCKPLPDITPLTHYVALGFLDLSYTNVSFRALQSALNRTHIIRFNCVGCKLIQSVETEYNRGFLMFVVPNIWILNGIFISW
jgi:hypothetical protein